jgi:predicted transcriptional regulator
MQMNIKDAFERIFKMPEFPRVRASDPVTSHEAAEDIKPAIAQHHQIILECLQEYGALGKDGISALTSLEGNQVARRLNEMKKLGLIHLTGKTVKSNSGRNEREWSCHTQM